MLNYRINAILKLSLKQRRAQGRVRRTIEIFNTPHAAKIEEDVGSKKCKKDNKKGDPFLTWHRL